MKITDIKPHSSSLGLDANLLSAITFVVMAIFLWIPVIRWIAWAVPLVVIFLEKKSGFVKFQASTALVVGIILSAIIILFQIIIRAMTPSQSDIWGMIDFSLGKGWERIEFMINFLRVICVIFTLLFAFLAFMAFTYKQMELPLIGSIADKVSGKLDNMSVNSGSQRKSSGSNKDDQIFCGECGAKNPKGTKFCGGCGKKL